MPDLAVREHLQISSVIGPSEIGSSLVKQISKIAVTCGPGLIGCLGVGIGIAKTLGLVWGIPVYGVNHLRARSIPIYDSRVIKPYLGRLFAYLGLLVSGAIHYFLRFVPKND